MCDKVCNYSPLLIAINIIPCFALIILIIFACVPSVSCPENSIFFSRKNNICLYENLTITKAYISNEAIYISTLCAYLTIIPALFIISTILYFSSL